MDEEDSVPAPDVQYFIDEISMDEEDPVPSPNVHYFIEEIFTDVDDPVVDFIFDPTSQENEESIPTYKDRSSLLPYEKREASPPPGSRTQTNLLSFFKTL